MIESLAMLQGKYGMLQDELSSFQVVIYEGKIERKTFQRKREARQFIKEMWRLLDPEAHLISFKQLMDRVICVKSRVEPLVPLQKKVYLSILKRELPMLLALSILAKHCNVIALLFHFKLKCHLSLYD
ncbi:hypothetical protein Syun_007138 [Stephania yunnanensis]|uniref:Uncharacterized protein n=1 Tax=Stephania yunnanensis TaxID=152371 RepID=A0AAP0KXX1_9MAGN